MAGPLGFGGGGGVAGSKRLWVRGHGAERLERWGVGGTAVRVEAEFGKGRKAH